MIASLLSTGLLYAALVRAVPPAGPGLNMHISADVMNLHVHLNASVAFGLVDTYDHTNWFSKFDTKNVSLFFGIYVAIFVQMRNWKLTLLSCL